MAGGYDPSRPYESFRPTSAASYFARELFGPLSGPANAPSTGSSSLYDMRELRPGASPPPQVGNYIER